MQFDFTTILERKGNDSLAYDNIGKKMWGNEPEYPKEGFSSIPMWVADMNFATCPSVIESIARRIQHPTFGYFVTRNAYYQAIIDWQTEHNKVKNLTKEMIGYENGVHGCISSAISVLSQPGDSIFVHSPFYVGFCDDIEKSGRKLVYSELKKDEQGTYRMDFDEMERIILENKVHLAIFCSPHNPTGRVWERWELEKAMSIFEKHHVYIISDEIWSDLTFKGYQHIPTQMVNEYSKKHTIATYAPSKTFNLAGLVGSYHIIYDKYLRDRISAYEHMTHYNEQNVLSMHALMGAYSQEGNEWVEQLKDILEKNCCYVVNFIKNEFSGIEVTMPQGTYMIFLDCKVYCDNMNISLDEVLKSGWDVGIGWQDGRAFGGMTHIRMNLASPFSMIEEACCRLKKYVFKI